MECKVTSGKSRVRSVKCGVWSVKCGVWSVEWMCRNTWLCSQVGMSQSATPATQNDMTTCLETFEKDRFSSFPHRHGDATGTPTARDKTRRGCRKTSISYETSSNFHSWQHDKRTSFAASPIDTATPQENQRLETRHVGVPKRTFRTRLPPILTLCSFKIDVFLRVFLRS